MLSVGVLRVLRGPLMTDYKSPRFDLGWRSNTGGQADHGLCGQISDEILYNSESIVGPSIRSKAYMIFCSVSGFSLFKRFIVCSNSE